MDLSFLNPDPGFLDFSLLTFLHVLLRAMKSRVLFPRTVWDSQACHKRMKDHEKVLTCFPNQILRDYRDRLKGVQIQLSTTQSWPSRTGKQQQEQISPNHVHPF